MAKFTLYTNPQSRGRIVRWMLEELGAAYETHPLAFGAEMHGKTYRAINPMAKVPALVHEGTVITEVAAIIAYLADLYPETGLAPAPGKPERGTYYRWMFFGAGPLDAASSHAGLGLVPETPQDQGRVGYGSLGRVCDTLEGVLADQDWIMGAEFSAADVVIASQLGFALMLGTITDRPVLSAYVGRAMARPAAVRTRELDDALAAEMAGSG